MDDISELQIGDLTVRIDRLLCVGFEDCLDAAGQAFELDAEGVAIFKEDAESTGRAEIIAACEACPVDALTAHDRDGARVSP